MHAYVTSSDPVSPLEPAPHPWVRLLLADPELGASVPAEDRELARRIVIARTVAVPAGEWDGRAPAREGAFAAVILDGLLARDCRLGGRWSTILLGPGDVLPVDCRGSGDDVAVLRWRAVTDARLAVLDRRFVAAVARWPWLTADLMRRAVAWADRAAVLQAIGHQPSVANRIVALMWHLAGQWGRVRPEGVVVPLKLSHAAVGDLVGARRPTVSLALRALRDHAVLCPLEEGWLLDADAAAALDGSVRRA